MSERDQDIFDEAAEIEDGPLRRAFLDRACAGDAELRRRVEVLLEAHSAASGSDGFLGGKDGSTVRLPADREEPILVGRYRLLQKLGEGGCGLVFMAEQAEPVRRRVALKIIKPGMDTRQVLARFEAERQALAMMDHPNIARVLDAGATDAGRPYFVMELVQGVPITTFCDEKKLSTAARLELFIQVCHAVQHAQPAERHATVAVVHHRLSGSPACPPEGNHPPGHQADEHPGDVGRRAADGEGDRLRCGQGDDRHPVDGQDAVHAFRDVRRDSGVHEPGEGGFQRAGCGHADGRLVARRVVV